MITDTVRRAVRRLRPARPDRLSRALAAAGPAGLASAATPDTTGPAEALNGYQVLDEVLRLPVSTWRYHWDPPHVRHLGPMAQDWHAAFGLGANNVTISATDANGVALVCVQALHRHIDDLRSEIATLQERIARLEEPYRSEPHGSEPSRSQPSRSEPSTPPAR
ncbi:tail fiber domain-containing protein [Streptomyces sp. NPDC056672]|uniref:tail fiber domain-containing protein n=1 Tax=Streptomyces sp. NPDC056672 TaxID=3345906 RepID=UPI003679CBED